MLADVKSRRALLNSEIEECVTETLRNISGKY